MTQKSKREELLKIKSGTNVGRYIIQNEIPIGKGGSGIVYKAKQIYCQDDTISSERAIKFFLYDEKHSNLGIVSIVNFEFEIRNITRLNHQNILKVIDGGYYSCEDYNKNKIEIPYIVTDFVNGENLENAFDNSDITYKWTENEIFDILIEILSAIDYLHSNDFYHCDIAPKNIFLRNDKNGKKHAILGDLGAGHTREDNFDHNKEITVIGTRDYMSPEAKSLKGHTIRYEDFLSLQPQWDIYSTVKTIIEIIDKVNKAIDGDTWHIDRLKEKLLQDNDYTCITELLDDIKHLSPSSSTIYNLSELSEASHEIVEKLIPCGSVFLSRRMRKLTKTNAMLRLMNVPQLLEGATTFPGANHTRYEHSLGTYELMRKAIVALLGNQYFTNSLSERNVILALLGALFSSLANYPYSYAIQEIRFSNKEIYKKLDRREIFKSFIQRKDDDVFNKSLFDVISELFPEYYIDIQEIEYVIYGKKDIKDPNLHNLYLLLNSSIGVRIIDYLRRDAHHIGLSCNIDTEDLFENLAMIKNEFCITQRGLSAAEEIIISRYWMFKRIYWSQPNRANAALLKYMFYRIYKDYPEIEQVIADNAFSTTKEQLMEIIKKESELKGFKDVVALADFILAKGRKQYKVVLVLDNNAAYGSASSSCRSFAELPYSRQYEVRKKLEEAVCDKYSIDLEKVSIEKGVILLIDMPEEHFENKTGSDIRIKHFKGNMIPLEQASDLIRGMSKNYIDQLRILRVYMHPDIYDKVLEMDNMRKKGQNTFSNDSTIDEFLNEELQKII